MRTYYRGNDAHVTEAHFVWQTSPPRTFVVDDLRDIVKVCADPRPTRSIATRLTAASAALLAAGWPMLDAVGPTWTAVAALPTVAALAVVAHHWRAPRRWELHAVYRGRRVVIYSTADVQAYNQITRGLRRALESSGTRPGFGLAS